MAKCDICDTDDVKILINNGPDRFNYCEMCWYHKNAPIMILAKPWEYFDLPIDESMYLFSPKLDRYIRVLNGQMKQCGFKLFNKKIFLNSRANRKYKEVLSYKYSGNLQCMVFDEYRNWPSGMRKCLKTDCSLC